MLLWVSLMFWILILCKSGMQDCINKGKCDFRSSSWQKCLNRPMPNVIQVILLWKWLGLTLSISQISSTLFEDHVLTHWWSSLWGKHAATWQSLYILCISKFVRCQSSILDHSVIWQLMRFDTGMCCLKLSWHTFCVRRNYQKLGRFLGGNRNFQLNQLAIYAKNCSDW